MSEVKKPFRRGKCGLCHSDENLVNPRLCHKCVEYVWQDHVAQREFVEGDAFVGQHSSCASSDECWCGELAKNGNPRLMNKALRMGKLTHPQRQIMKLYFVDCLTLTEISEKLGITKQSAFNRYTQAVKKLQKYPSIVHIVKGKDKKQTEYSIENKARLPQEKYAAPLSCKKELQKLTIDPYDYYSSCPKCGEVDFHGTENTAKCMKCAWTFRVHTVDEVLASNSWPDEWIQKQYFSGPFFSKF